MSTLHYEEELTSRIFYIMSVPASCPVAAFPGSVITTWIGALKRHFVGEDMCEIAILCGEGTSCGLKESAGFR